MASGFFNSLWFSAEGLLLARKGNKRKDRYGSAEFKFLKELRDWLKENHAIHEYTFNVNWEGDKYHYYGDFFLVDKLILLEIDPDFHDSFKEVSDRDDFRDWVLMKTKQVETIRIKESDIRPEYLNGLVAYVNDKPIVKTSLMG